MSRCPIHPSRPATEIVGARLYCAECACWMREGLCEIKRCACGRTFTRAEWDALPILGRVDNLELRNCPPPCHSTLAIEHDTPAPARPPDAGCHRPASPGAEGVTFPQRTEPAERLPVRTPAPCQPARPGDLLTNELNQCEQTPTVQEG